MCVGGGRTAGALFKHFIFSLSSGWMSLKPEGMIWDRDNLGVIQAGRLDERLWGIKMGPRQRAGSTML